MARSWWHTNSRRICVSTEYGCASAPIERGSSWFARTCAASTTNASASPVGRCLLRRLTLDHQPAEAIDDHPIELRQTDRGDRPAACEHLQQEARHALEIGRDDPRMRAPHDRGDLRCLADSMSHGERGDRRETRHERRIGRTDIVEDDALEAVTLRHRQPARQRRQRRHHQRRILEVVETSGETDVEDIGLGGETGRHEKRRVDRDRHHLGLAARGRGDKVAMRVLIEAFTAKMRSASARARRSLKR